MQIEKPAHASCCGICLSPIEHAEGQATCPECKAIYHEECWQENHGCAVYGCSQAPKIEQRNTLEIPVAYWGQQSKSCPACGKEILAVAIRCRFCGATFASAQPEDTQAFGQRTRLEQRLPGLRHSAVWIFVLSVLPCSAPIGAVWGIIWYASNKADFHAVPSLYPALCKIGIGVGVGQTALMIIVTLIYAALQQA